MLLRHARYLVAIADHGNFTRCEALHVSQPTLSQQIRQLEDTLPAPLHDRSGRPRPARICAGPPPRERSLALETDRGA